jgi:hypothetical protein
VLSIIKTLSIEKDPLAATIDKVLIMDNTLSLDSKRVYNVNIGVKK